MEFDIKIDYSDGAPFKVRQIKNNGDVFYREIDPKDEQFYEYLPQTQKYQQIKRLDDQSQLLQTSQINNKTVIISDIHQLSDKSDLFLVILLYDNQNTYQVHNYIKNLHTEQDKIRKTKVFQKFIVVIIINNRHQVQLKINEPKQYFDDSSAKLLVNQEMLGIKTQIFILNSKQDTLALNNLIYQGFAAHFKPKYLLVQEFCYQITNLADYFNHSSNVAAIVPQKDYEKQNQLTNYLLFQQYKLQYEQYINYHNKQNTYYDSFNCFYNYEIAKQFLQPHMLDIQNQVTNQEFCYLNMQFCQRIYNNKFQVLQKNRIEYASYDQQQQCDQNSELFGKERKEFQDLIDEPQKNVQFYLKSLKLKKEINFILKQYLETNKMKLVLIVDYLQLSQYFFIIIMLPYYFIREQSDSQSTQVFISIIPGFIVILLSIILIITDMIFCLCDPLIVGNSQKEAKVPIYKIKQKYHYYDYFGNEDRFQQLNETYCIEKGNLLFNLDPELCQKFQEYNFQMIKLNPKIITYPVLWIQNKLLNFIVIILNMIYYALTIYLLIYYIQSQDSVKQYISLLIAILIVIQIFLSLQYKSKCFRYLFNQAFQFIQINIFNHIIESYTKSNQVEHNYYLLRNFIVQIFYNILFLVAFIVVDYSNNFNGGVFLGILFFQMVRQFNYLISILFNRLFGNLAPNNQPEKNQQQIDQNQLMENEEKLNKKANELIGNTYVHASGLLQQPQNQMESKLLQDKTMMRNENLVIQNESDEQAIDVQDGEKLFQKIKSNDGLGDEGKPLFEKAIPTAKYQSQISGRDKKPHHNQQFQDNKSKLFQQ
ncbi:hypothetical protein pb186bvf_006698 [Paramecium bursaria]